MDQMIPLSELIPRADLARSVLLCSVAGDELSAVWCQAKSSGRDAKHGKKLPKVSRHELANAEQTKAMLRKAGSECPVILVLPRSQYLTREFLLPVVAEDEVPGMVALEAEAEAPPGMEEIEVAYRAVGEPLDGRQRYEVFFARQTGLADLLSQADTLGLAFDHILPNSVLLEWLFDQPGISLQMLVYTSGPDQLELAVRKTDGRLTVRTLGSIAAGRSRLAQVISEMTRGTQIEGQGPVSLAWLDLTPEESGVGDAFPWLDEQGIATDDLFDNDPVFAKIAGTGDGAAENKKDDKGPSSAHEDEASRTCQWGYLGVMGVGLLESEVRRSVRQVDLMPQSRRNAKVMRRVVVSSLWTGGALVAVLVLVSVGLWLFANRYETHRNQLAEQIQAIEVEGREVSRRIDQLDAMHDAWDRRNLMRDVLAALYEASPPGLEYHQIEVKEDGSCYLRGQAQSVALPFELPERLEAQPIFTDVTLSDAGQARRGAGSVTEFRIDCRVVVPPPVSVPDNAGQQARRNP